MPSLPPALWRAVLVALVVGNAALGAWMLASPATWFELFPAKLHETGPLNVHFVGDVGTVYVFTAAASAAVLRAPRSKEVRGVFVSAAAMHAMHALWHVYETGTGRLPFPDRFVTDIPVRRCSVLRAYSSGLRGSLRPSVLAFRRVCAPPC